MLCLMRLQIQWCDYDNTFNTEAEERRATTISMAAELPMYLVREERK